MVYYCLLRPRTISSLCSVVKHSHIGCSRGCRSQEEKANPMYQSNEDIAGAGEEEEGGYLDVAPEDEVKGADE